MGGSRAVGFDAGTARTKGVLAGVCIRLILQGSFRPPQDVPKDVLWWSEARRARGDLNLRAPGPKQTIDPRAPIDCSDDAP
jgi:hypothetical protein